VARQFDEVSKANLQFGPPPVDASFDIEPPTLPDQTKNYPLPRPAITKFL
jgi:hypothetical protein